MDDLLDISRISRGTMSKRRSQEAGFDRHLMKPVDESEVLEVLRTRTECRA